MVADAVSRNGTYQLVGLHEPRPFLRVGTAYFRGEAAETIGTDLIFEADDPPPQTESGQPAWRRVGMKNPPMTAPAAGAQPHRKEASLVGRTTKKIMFSRVQMSLKEPAKEEPAKEEEQQPVTEEAQPMEVDTEEAAKAPEQNAEAANAQEGDTRAGQRKPSEAEEEMEEEEEEEAPSRAPARKQKRKTK